MRLILDNLVDTDCLRVLCNEQTTGMGYIGVLWGIILGGWLSAMLKSKDLMVSRLSDVTG